MLSEIEDKRLDLAAKEIAASAEKLDQWMAIEELGVMDVVRVERNLASADEALQVALPNGSVGVVENVDEDGDALVCFPALIGSRCSATWVTRTCFPKVFSPTCADTET